MYKMPKRKIKIEDLDTSNIKEIKQIKKVLKKEKKLLDILDLLIIICNKKINYFEDNYKI